MRPLLYRLYRTKIALTATISIAIGLVLLVAAHNIDDGWFADVPAGELGGLLFGAGLFGQVWEYAQSRDADERQRLNIAAVFDEKTPALRDTVIDGFAADPDRLTRLASPDTLDRVIGNCLAVRLGDAELATDVYNNLREQVVGASERRYDARVTVTLTPWENGPETGQGSSFVATTRWEYRTNNVPDVLRFSTVNNQAAYRRLLRDPSSAEVWLFEPTSGASITTPQAYQLLACTIDGQPQHIDHHATDSSRRYEVTVDRDAVPADGPVHVTYTQSALVTQHGHLLFLDFDKPTKGLRVDFFYGGCGIRHVSYLDFISSATQPRVERSPANVPTPTISLAFDGWVLPRAGVAFIWVLDREIDESSLK